MPKKNPNNEVLLNNVLEKDFQKMIFPLNLMQNIVLLTKYQIRDNFVTSNSQYISIFSLCITLFLATTWIEFVVQHLLIYINSKEYVAITSLFYDLFFIPFCLILNYVQNVYLSNENVKLILKLHKIEKVTGFSKNNPSFTIWNWATTLSMFLFVILAILKSFISLSNLFYFFIGYSLIINIIYAARIIALLKKYLKTWTNLLNVNLPNHLMEKQSRIFQHESLYKCYVNIFNAYNIFKKTFQVMVSFICIL